MISFATASGAPETVLSGRRLPLLRPPLVREPFDLLAFAELGMRQDAGAILGNPLPSIERQPRVFCARQPARPSSTGSRVPPRSLRGQTAPATPRERRATRHVPPRTGRPRAPTPPSRSAWPMAARPAAGPSPCPGSRCSATASAGAKTTFRMALCFLVQGGRNFGPADFARLRHKTSKLRFRRVSRVSGARRAAVVGVWVGKRCSWASFCVPRVVRGRQVQRFSTRRSPAFGGARSEKEVTRSSGERKRGRWLVGGSVERPRCERMARIESGSVMKASSRRRPLQLGSRVRQPCTRVSGRIDEASCVCGRSPTP